MGEKLSDWLVKQGWKRLDDGKTLYSGEGDRFRKPTGYAAHGELWIAPWEHYSSPGSAIIDTCSLIAGYFIDEDRASHEYVFGPAAKQLAKAITAFNKGG